MSWPADFRARLDSGALAPIYALTVDGSPVILTTADVAVSGGLGLTVAPWLDIGALTFGSAGVAPIEWTPEAGAWRFGVLVGGPGDGRLLTALRALRRGNLVRLRMGFPGMAYTDYQPVAAGRVAGIANDGRGTLTCEVWDLVSALAGRMRGDGDLRSEPQLFSAYRAPGSISGVGYVVGDTTLRLAAAPPSGVRLTGGTGAVKVTPASGAEAFYLTYTGIATGPDRLTGIATADVHGTVRVNAAIGSVVEFVPFVYGDIRQFVARILTSTGSGGNGPYDVLPRDWGYALRDGLEVDIADIFSVVNDILAPGSAGANDIEAIVDPLPADGGQWLTGILQGFGAFLTLRQGLLTLRCAQDIRPQSRATARIQRLRVTDAQAVEGPAVEQATWSNLTYGPVGIKSTSGTTTGAAPASQYPMGGLKVYDVTPYLWSNETAMRAAAADRLSVWANVLPEVISADFAGLWHWTLCPGDVVLYSGTRTGGLYLSTAAGWTDRMALVVSVQPDPLRGTVALTLATLPDDAADRLEV